jgi:hypothetical protein
MKLFTRICCLWVGALNEYTVSHSFYAGEPSSPRNIYAVATILDPTENDTILFVFYDWKHSNPEQVLYYKTKIVQEGETIHEMNVTGEVMNATCQLDSLKGNGSNYTVIITAVDRCGNELSDSTMMGIKENDCNTVPPDKHSQCVKFIVGLTVPMVLFIIVIVFETMLICYLCKDKLPKCSCCTQLVKTKELTNTV